MILTVVGSGTLVPTPRRSTPALALQEGDTQVTVDGGSGSLRRQAELGIDFRRTGALLFTHVHPDHTLDVLHFLFATRHAPGGPREAPPTLVGPPGFAGYLDRLRDGVRGWTDGGPAGFRVRELGDRETVRLGAIEVQAVRLEHPVVNHGYRVRSAAGGTVSITGDSERCEALLDLARGADVLVADCSGDREHPFEGHLGSPEVGDIAARANVGQLVLTHLYPLPDDRRRLAEVAERFSGPVLLAEDGMRFLI